MLIWKKNVRKGQNVTYLYHWRHKSETRHDLPIKYHITFLSQIKKTYFHLD